MPREQAMSNRPAHTAESCRPAVGHARPDAASPEADLGPGSAGGTADRHADRLHDAVVTDLLLAGEALAAPLREAERFRDRAPHAVSASSARDSSHDCAWIVDVARHAAMRLAEEPQRAGLAASLCDALGDGQALALMFGGFFPARKPPIHLDADGRALLTRRQVEILREASRDLTHAEIAENLGVSPRTVSTHLERIYRRLGVSKPMQAVAHAIALGYLDLNAVRFVQTTSGSSLRDHSTLHVMLSKLENVEEVAGGRPLRRLAQFGVLLAVCSAAASIILRGDVASDAAMVGVVCRLDRDGRVREAFGGDRLRAARAVAVAPAAAERHGFVPGALYVANAALAQHGLNTAEILEYRDGPARDGRACRAFTGGREIATRLADPTSLAFDTDGRLLATSGPLTDGILAFTDGGARVARLATARDARLAVGPTGALIVACREPSGSVIQSHDLYDGQVYTIARAEHGVSYCDVATRSDGGIYVVRVRRGRGAIEELAASGEPMRLFTAPGMRDAAVAVDRTGRILATCPASGDVKVFAPDGRLERRLPLDGVLAPTSIAVGPDDSIWVCGQAE